MKINIHSITFKIIATLFVTSALFIVFILIGTKYTFSQGYINLVEDEIHTIQNNISPSIALNLSYGFNDALDEIVNNQLKNKKILLLKIDSSYLNSELIISNVDKSEEELKKDGHFILHNTLIDPATYTRLGEMTIVYSNKSYKTHMQKFYRWFGLGMFIFSLIMTLLGLFLYNSLKHLTTLAKSFENFNPNKPENFSLNINSNNEIGVITKSANKMIEKLTNYITSNKNLNEAILQKETHLKDAQRIARVGSWEYNINKDEFVLSDEIYRILGVKLNNKMSWNNFLNFISKDDYKRVTNIINKAIENGSQFDIKYSLTHNNNNKIHIKTKGKVRKKQDGCVKITAVSMDITNDIKNKNTIEKLAYYDSLTGLANRTLLKDRMHKAIQRAARDKVNLAVIFLDLDHFKLINDTLGHSVGDELLISISKVLHSQIRESDTLSRLGGDEFIILLPSINSAMDAQNIAHKIQKLLDNKHDIGSHQLYLTTSIGVSLYPEHGATSEELIRNADTAMYEAKNSGRNRYKIYTNSMGNYIDKKLHLEQDLIQAVKSNNELEVFYQAKIDGITQRISGAEALVRWRHPTKGLIFPDEFIHIAESTGLMIELGNTIIEESIAQVQKWNALGYKELKIAINLSARQFQDSNLASFISSMIDKYQVNPAQLEFEITETLSMINLSNTMRILTELKAIGLSIAIDDFGTGHSSLSYLKKFPVNTLKIDRSFVMDLVDNDEDRVIVQTIITLAHSLGLTTVAEGVETKEDVEVLREMECDELQGYYFSRPIPTDDFTKFLQDYIPNA